jgi:type IV fimbrial biogenesis protein FimT
MAVSCLLALVSVPNLGPMLNRQAVQADVDEFRLALRRGRLEAIRRGAQVTVCARDPRDGPGNSRCAATGTDWSAGWLVFVDDGERGAFDEQDELVLAHQAGRWSGPVRGTLRALSFQPTGISTSASARFRFQPRSAWSDDDVASGSLTVCVNKPGRSRVLRAPLCS